MTGIGKGNPRTATAWPWLALAGVLALAGCQQQQQTPAPEGAVQIVPAAIALSPGEQVQFTVASPLGADVTWAVSPPTEGTITSGGLFTASSNPGQLPGTCTVFATLRSDPTKVGLSVVVLRIEPPVNAVAASGQQQSAEGIAVESVVAEPIGTVVSRDTSGVVESRSGFYPSGSVAP